MQSEKPIIIVCEVNESTKLICKHFSEIKMIPVRTRTKEEHQNLIKEEIQRKTFTSPIITKCY